MAEESTFAAILRELRLAAGLTQKGLAERARISVQGVSALERGARKVPRSDTVELLASALDVSDEDRRRLRELAVRLSQQHRRGARGSMIRELDKLADLFRSRRIVTLCGPAGTGKTRLAREFVGRVRGFPDGVWFVDLAPVDREELVASSVATALSIDERIDQPLLETLVDALQGNAMLLVLDKCEQVIDSCAVLCERLLQRCAALHVLATSREPLRINGEVVYRIGDAVTS